MFVCVLVLTLTHLCLVFHCVSFVLRHKLVFPDIPITPVNKVGGVGLFEFGESIQREEGHVQQPGALPV